MMTNEETVENGLTKMSVARALSRVKTLKAKIEQQLSEPIKFFHVTQGTTDKRLLTPGETFQSVDAKAQGFIDSLEKNMSNYIRLKEALAASNAITKIVIAGKEYTITGCLELKKQIAIKEKIVSAIRRQHNEVTVVVNRSNEQMEKTLAEDKSENKQVIEGDSHMKIFTELQKAQRDLSTANLHDTIDSAKLIERYTAEIEAVKTDLDYMINQSNMVTTITVDLR